MKKIVLLSVLFLLLSNVCFAQNIKYGALNINSEIVGVEIYVDGEIKGKDMVKIGQIQAGSHLIKAISGNSVIYNNVVNVPEGNLITVVIGANNKEQNSKQAQVIRPSQLKVYGGMQNQQLTVVNTSTKYTNVRGLNIGLTYNSHSLYGLGFYGDLAYTGSTYNAGSSDFPLHLVTAGVGPFCRFRIFDLFNFVVLGGLNYDYVIYSPQYPNATVNGAGFGFGSEFGSAVEIGNLVVEWKHTRSSPYMRINSSGVIPAGVPASSSDFDLYTNYIRVGWIL